VKRSERGRRYRSSRYRFDSTAYVVAGVTTSGTRWTHAARKHTGRRHTLMGLPSVVRVTRSPTVTAERLGRGVHARSGSGPRHFAWWCVNAIGSWCLNCWRDCYTQGKLAHFIADTISFDTARKQGLVGRAATRFSESGQITGVTPQSRPPRRPLNLPICVKKVRAAFHVHEVACSGMAERPRRDDRLQNT
jgi:hypothetical protein